jgi:hypothetical protein
MKYLVCHYWEVRRFAWIEATDEDEAIEKAVDDYGKQDWDDDETDPGEFEIREREED